MARLPRLRISKPVSVNLGLVHPILDHPQHESQEPVYDQHGRIANHNFEIQPLSYPTPTVEDSFSRNLFRKTLHIRRTVNMTRKGKIPSMSALVVVGNGHGAAGIGIGKAQELAHAVRKATEQAVKAMSFFERFDSRTIFHQIEYKYKASKITFRPRPPGIFFCNNCRFWNKMQQAYT